MSKKIKSAVSVSTLAILIALLSFLTIMSLIGYSFDTETNEITKNGVIRVDSRPNDAGITVNDRALSDTTGAYITIEEGLHNVKLNKEGYYSWGHEAQVTHSEVVDLTYALLVPHKPQTEKLVSTTNNLSSFNSNDQHLLYLVNTQLNSQDQLNYLLNIYSYKDKEYIIKNYKLDIGSSTQKQQLRVIAVKDDLVIIKQQLDDNKKYLVFNTKQPDQPPVDITKQTNGLTEIIDFTGQNQILFRQSKQLKLLSNIDSTSKLELKTLAKDVTSFTLLNEELRLFYQKQNSKTVLEMKVNSQDTEIKTVNGLSGQYSSLDSYKFDGQIYLVTTSRDDIQTITKSYKLSAQQLEESEPTVSPAQDAGPQLVWSTTLEDVRFAQSDNGRFISLNNDIKAYTRDNQTNKSATFQLSDSIDASSVAWVNDYYFVASLSNKEAFLLSDYDGVNQIKLATTEKISNMLEFTSNRQDISYLDENNSVRKITLKPVDDGSPEAP